LPRKERKEGQEPTRREYSDCNFDKLVDEALGLDKNNNEREMMERQIMKATQRDLLKYMHTGKWQKISEFKYRRPQLRKFVEELEISWFDDHEA
jgi:hypothetical protein